MNQKGLIHILIVLILLAGLGATLYLSQHTQIFKPKAAGPSETELTSLTAFEKKVAGIDVNGKLITEKAKFLAEVYPKGYQELLSRGLIENPDEVENKVQNQRLKEERFSEERSQRPVITSSSVSSCGDITSSGNYSLTQDISAAEQCIEIYDTQNVNLDCNNHIVESRLGGNSNLDIPLVVNRVQNFSIKNCNIKPDSNNLGNAIWILSSNFGIIEHNTSSPGKVRVFDIQNSNNLQIIDNTMNASLRLTNSSLNQIHDNHFNNHFSHSTVLVSAGVVILTGGHNNSILNNTMDGAWDGIYPESNAAEDYQGADDGIILLDESKDEITGNTISNNWDCGIETLGFIQDTQIRRNRINNSGSCGIGGWYWNSWLRNTLDSNFIDKAKSMFVIYYANFSHPEAHSTDDVYFKDNTFSNNIFSHQLVPKGGHPAYAALINYGDLGYGISESHIFLGNNIFKDNDFDANLPGPVLIPASMIVDQGGNKCLQVNDNLHPLNCNSSSTSPTPAPVMRCITDSECGERMRCLLPVCANPDPEQICREAPDKANCFAQVEQKARQRCAGRCVKTPGF